MDFLNDCAEKKDNIRTCFFFTLSTSSRVVLVLFRDREFVLLVDNSPLSATGTLTLGLFRFRLPEPRPVIGIVFDGKESASWNFKSVTDI